MEASKADKELDGWQQRTNAHAGFCLRNHSTVSAKAMKSDGAEILGSFSMKNHQLLYNIFGGDGDSYSHGRVVTLQPYGCDHPIEKEDCVGHVQKCMETGLQEALKCHGGKELEDGKGICGRNHLTKT